ncbi:hypothetical protein ARMSODRAFT_978107 [Armillaria solidipes]|uniref:Uncharacterized protein n=1 Tax=Armillaria solidipes TaxID=1076256 RepID=A0A2H3BM44_9AGAR|nr:hypothetical protein ARMSODRAFT_978107 [Armillaria solidipes]
MQVGESEQPIPQHIKEILERKCPVYWGVLFSSRGKAGRLVPVPLISLARDYRSWDDLNTAEWIPRFPPYGAVVNTNIGRKILEMSYLVYYYSPGYRDTLSKNRALAKEDISFKGDVLVMRLEFNAELERYCVQDMEADDIQHALFYIQRVLYERDLYPEQESATTVLYTNTKDQEIFHGCLLGRLHSAQCLTGELLFLYLKNNNWLRLGPTTHASSGRIHFNAQVNVLKGIFYKDKAKNGSSASWIFESDREFIMLYVNPTDITVYPPADFHPRRLPPRNAVDVLDDVDDELVKLNVVLRKHTSTVTKERTELYELTISSHDALNKYMNHVYHSLHGKKVLDNTKHHKRMLV